MILNLSFFESCKMIRDRWWNSELQLTHPRRLHYVTSQLQSFTLHWAHPVTPLRISFMTIYSLQFTYQSYEQYSETVKYYQEVFFYKGTKLQEVKFFSRTDRPIFTEYRRRTYGYLILILGYRLPGLTKNPGSTLQTL